MLSKFKNISKIIVSIDYNMYDMYDRNHIINLKKYHLIFQ